jgi:pilus assembly protein CpaE
MLGKKHHGFGFMAPHSKWAPQLEETLRSHHAVATDPSPYSASEFPDSIGADALSIVLIGPEEDRRSSAMMALTACAGADVHEYAMYPQSADEVPQLLSGDPDAVLIDLDSDPETALELVENICAHGTATVMVFSEKADPELLVRCMRAGAREFLSFPLETEVMEEALVRAAARKPQTKAEKKATGRLLTFMGAKGGAGATMLACNFAVALAKESGQKTILIDLDVPLGDAALNMGITAEFSTIDALNAVERLDGRFLQQLLVKHSSGVSVLAAPGRFLQYQANTESIDWLLHVARQEFENVVVDLGSKLDLMGTAAYKEASTFYLVTQSSIPELRNSNRLVQQFFGGTVPKLEIVINRYESRTLGVSDEHITKALTRPAQWKIPNDYASVRKMQINATPLVLADSAITRQIRQMAKSVTGEEAAPAEKKKGFKLFG